MNEPELDKRHITVKIWRSTRYLANMLSAKLDTPALLVIHQALVDKAERLGLDVTRILNEYKDK